MHLRIHILSASGFWVIFEGEDHFDLLEDKHSSELSFQGFDFQQQVFDQVRVA